MEIIEEGKEYKARNVTKLGGETFQTIRFVSKEQGELVDGTTNEELFKILLNRFFYLQKRNPSAKNSVVIELLKVCINTLSKRYESKLKKKYGEATS